MLFYRTVVEGGHLGHHLFDQRFWQNVTRCHASSHIGDGGVTPHYKTIHPAEPIVIVLHGFERLPRSTTCQLAHHERQAIELVDGHQFSRELQILKRDVAFPKENIVTGSLVFIQFGTIKTLQTGFKFPIKFTQCIPVGLRDGIGQ